MRNTNGYDVLLKERIVSKKRELVCAINEIKIEKTVMKLAKPVKYKILQ